jgi:hypothetical protein
VTITIDPIRPFDMDMKTLFGWKLERDCEYQPGDVTLELAEFLKRCESWVKGTVMLDRAKAIGADLGQKHAEVLLENKHLIPSEWKNHYLIFPGTVWRVLPHGGRHVPCLRWRYDQWLLHLFRWLGGKWGADDRLVRSRISR